MTELIKSELLQMLLMFYCGLAIMVVFTFRDRITARCAGRRRLCAAVYLGCWVCGGFLFGSFLYSSAHGVITLHGILSAGAGILLWKKWICGIIFTPINAEGQECAEGGRNRDKSI